MKLARALVVSFLALGLGAGPALAETPPPPLAAPAQVQNQLAQNQLAPSTFADLAQRLLPAVVNISTTQVVKDKGVESDMGDMPDMQNMPPGFEEFFKNFMNKQRPLGPDGKPAPRDRKTTSLGSGFLIDPKGYVVTNNHVIQDADEINVILHDDTNLKAKLVGRDPKTDLALLKVEYAKPLPYVGFGDSDKMRVGDWLVVIGNPFGLGGTVTQGIISARARDIQSGPYDDYIQTDASINRGNSGGPMFNLQGEVIGIATAIFSPSGGSVGIGFAIPSSMAKNVIQQLKDTGKIRRGWLGVRIQNVTEDIAKSLNLPKSAGALVSSVTPDSPAAKAGVQAGDVIITFDGKEVSDMRHLPRMVAETPIDHSVPMVVWRARKDVRLDVKIGEMKETDQADGGTEDEEKQQTLPAPKSTQVPELDIKVSNLTAEIRQQYQLRDDVKGLAITVVGANSPLEDKGAHPGDVIVEAAQKELKDVKELQAAAKDAYAGKKPLLLLIDRGGDLRFVAVNAIDPSKASKDDPKKDEKPEKKDDKSEKKDDKKKEDKKAK
jgi:serine protease Do